MLDNIDLGIFNMVHSVIPRVQCFDQKRISQIIMMAYCKQKDTLTYVLAAVSTRSVFASSCVCCWGWTRYESVMVWLFEVFVVFMCFALGL